MAEQAATNSIVHKWYARPVFFVDDVNRAARFYIDMLGFVKKWQKPTAQERSVRLIAANARSSYVRT